MKKLLLLTLCLMASVMTQVMAQNPVSYATDDEQDLHLHIRKQPAMDAAETRAFGDLKYNPPYMLHEGRVHVPIIMVDFPDQGFTFSKEELYDLFMGQHPIEKRPVKASSMAGYGYGSAQEFFYENSFGKLDIVFDFYGPYTLPKELKYYGEGEGRTLQRLTEDAIPLADDDIDFKKYDNDGDGICEIVYYLFAGQGSNLTNDKSQIWPKCGVTYNVETDDGIKINRAGANNELLLPEGNIYMENGKALINGIGVFCHELSHGMGLPDLYCSESWDNRDNNGPEDWDLMDNGENVNNGFWPTPYAAWERMIMGWMEAEQLTTEQDVTIWPLNDVEGRGKAFVVRNPDNADEFWTIENIPSDGWYAGLYGAGMGIIITHIDYTDDKFQVHSRPNNRQGKPRCTIIPADGRILSSYYLNRKHPDGTNVTYQVYENSLQGDPYPGSLGVTELKAYHNYTGEEDLVKTMPITNIHLNDNGSVSFHFGNETTGLQGISTIIASEPSQSYNLFGNKVNGNGKGLMIKSGRVVFEK